MKSTIFTATSTAPLEVWMKPDPGIFLAPTGKNRMIFDPGGTLAFLDGSKYDQEN